MAFIDGAGTEAVALTVAGATDCEPTATTDGVGTLAVAMTVAGAVVWLVGPDADTKIGRRTGMSS